MKRLWLTTILIALQSPAFAYDYWNDIRHSALLPDSSMVVRIENPSGFGVENFLLYRNGGIIEQAMIPVADGPSTLSATVPGPAAVSRYYGFRLIQDGELDFMPVPIAEGFNPIPADLTRLATDPAADHLFGFIHLDLVECRISFSATKIFAALQNAGGGFPVNQGLTFFGYLLAIADPSLAEPDTVFTLMHTYRQGNIVSPGLYRITGSGFGDLHRIGDISVQEFPSDNFLLLACNLADLMEDPYFQSWYEPEEPVLGVAAFTQRITLIDGAREADRTTGGRCHLRRLPIAFSENRLPGLSGLSIEGDGPATYARLAYCDPDGHCPVVAEMAFDKEPPCPMYPQSLDYGTAVEYRTGTGVAPLADGAWHQATARFSDNLSDTIKVVITSTGVSDDRQRAAPPHVQLLISPNPFNSTATLFYSLPVQSIKSKVEGEGALHFELSTLYVTLKIFNVLGQEVAMLVDEIKEPGQYTVTWNASDMSSGIYFCRLTAGEFSETKRMVLMK